MADRWFRIPETGDGSDAAGNANGPDYVDTLVEGWTAQEVHPNGSPGWVVRAYGSSSQLNDLASKNDVVELSRADAKSALDNMLGQTRTADEWESRFNIG